MKSILAIFTHKYLFLTALTWGWFEVIAIPKPMLIFWLFGAMLVDLITGLLKSWAQKKITTSDGLRKTVIKLGTYAGALIAIWILVNMLSLVYKTNFDYTTIVSCTIGFMTFIEVYSILENVKAIDPKGPLAKYIANPVLRFLRGRLKDNPINKLNDDEKHD